MDPNFKNVSKSKDAAVVGITAESETGHFSGNVNKNEEINLPPLISTFVNEEFNLPPLISTFVGREEEIEQLCSLLFVENKNMVFIHGLPGIGKSELAKQFADRCLKDGKIEKAYFIDFGNKYYGLDMAFQYLEYICEASRHRSCLIILDNVNYRYTRMLKFKYKYYQHFYLITSHYEDWFKHIPVIKLGPLNLNSAVDFYRNSLSSNYKEEDHALYVEIANLVNCIPLALQITAARIQEQQRQLYLDFNLHKYVEHLHQSPFELILEKIPSSSSNTYNMSIYEAIINYLNNIASIRYNDLAFKMLDVCSYLDTDQDGINDEILFNILSNFEEMKNKIKFDIVLEELENSSLITYNKHNISIHQLTQTVLRYDIYKNKGIFNSYAACLKFLLIYNKKVFYRAKYKNTIFSSLKYADENLLIFEAFYNNHKKIILNDLSIGSLLDDLLKYLIKYGCKQCVKYIFADLGDKSRECINQFNLLHEAIRHNQLDLLIYLLQHDVDINNKNENYDSPLHIAAFKWNLIIIQSLLNYNPDLGAKNKYGNTPVFEFFKGARYCKYIKVDEVNEILWYLRFNKYKNVNNYLNETVLHTAAASCQKELVLLLIQKYSMSVNIQDSDGQTPLHTLFSQVKNDPIDRTRIIETVKLLINHNADLDIKDKKDRTPLDIAILEQLDYFVFIMYELDNYDKKYINKYNLLHKIVFYNQLDMLKPLLTEYNIDVNITDDDLDTGLHIAAFQWNLKAIKCLLTYKADVHLRNKQGNTPLLEFCRGAYKQNDIDIDTIKETLKLLQFTKIRNTLNNDQETFLHLASASLNVEFVELLLENYDLDVNKIDCRYRTPLYAAISAANEPYATTEKITKITRVLRRSGAYIRHENMTLFERALESVYKFNLLHKLISSNLLQIFCLEFRTDIDVNIEDENMNTLLHTASLHGNLNAIELLVERNAMKTAENKFGNTPLFEFIRGTYNRENICIDEVNEIIDLLCYENIETIVNNKNKNTLLHTASFYGNLNAIELLVERNAMKTAVNKFGNTPLFEFVRSTYNRENICMDEVNDIIDLLCYGNIETIVNNKGETILHVAAASLNADLVNIFITKYKIDANVRNLTGNTPLHVLFSKLTEDDIANKLQRIYDTTMELKVNNASLNIKNSNHKTPIKIAKKYKNDSVLLILIFEDRYIEKIKKIFNNFGNSVKDFIDNYNLLHYAVSCNQINVLELLLQYNVNVNNTDKKKRTPLHLASFYWNIEAIKLLINHHADLNARCIQSRNAVHYFYKGGMNKQQINCNKIDEILKLLQTKK